jgi:hypothetical protein
LGNLVDPRSYGRSSSYDWPNYGVCPAVGTFVGTGAVLSGLFATSAAF